MSRKNEEFPLDIKPQQGFVCPSSTTGLLSVDHWRTGESRLQVNGCVNNRMDQKDDLKDASQEVITRFLIYKMRKTVIFLYQVIVQTKIVL